MEAWTAPEHSNPWASGMASMEEDAIYWLSPEELQDLMDDEPELQESHKIWARQLYINNSDLSEEQREWLDTERYDAKLDESLGVIPTKVSQKRFWTQITISDKRGILKTWWIDDFRSEEFSRQEGRFNENITNNVENAEKLKDEAIFACLVPNGRGKMVPCADIMELPSYGQKDREVIADIDDYLVDSQSSAIEYQAYKRKKKLKAAEAEAKAEQRSLERKQELEDQRLKRRIQMAQKRKQGIVRIPKLKEGERKHASTALFSL
jgi:hypothetical protein